MNSAAKHVLITGDRAADRARKAGTIDDIDSDGSDVVSFDCHRRLRGPYSGISVALHRLVPDALRRRPDLVATYLPCILYAAPDLDTVTGPAPPILTFSTPHEERTRFFGLGYVRAASHGIVAFLREYAQYARERDSEPLTLFFDNVHAADPTEQEFLALALRRCQPQRLRLIIGTASQEHLPDELAEALRQYAIPTAAPSSDGERAAGLVGGSDEELARAYIDADGTSDVPELLDAYQRSDPSWRAALHDGRADELEAYGDWSLRLGAIPFHREHGADPGGKGCDALLAAVEHCVAMGFYAALSELGHRGLAVTDPQARQVEFCHFTAKVASAATALGNPEESEELLLGLRERYALPRVHMSTSYNLAMLYTRWYKPQHKEDHNLAKGFCNNAMALAVLDPEPRSRAFHTVFQCNGLALVEMHRGNLEEARRLVTEGMQRLDRELEPEDYVVHRWQLLHNRARVLVAMGRLQEATADFDRLVAGDPNYTEYYIDRGNTARLAGDDERALADYERACELGMPFPEVYYNRGDLRAAHGDVAGAIADFGYVLDMEPEHLDARISRAELSIEAGDLLAAQADVAEGLARYPDSAELHALDGLTALLAGDPGRAREQLNRALDLDPDLAAARAHRAVLAAQSGDPEAAVADFTRVLELLGEDPDLRYGRGEAYLALGRPEQAAADLRAVVDAAGERAADARELLADIERAGGGDRHQCSDRDELTSPIEQSVRAEPTEPVTATAAGPAATRR